MHGRCSLTGIQDPEDWDKEATPLNALVSLLHQISEVMAQTSQFPYLNTGTIMASYERAIRALPSQLGDEGSVLVVGVGTCIPSLLAAKLIVDSEVSNWSECGPEALGCR